MTCIAKNGTAASPILVVFPLSVSTRDWTQRQFVLELQSDA